MDTLFDFQPPKLKDQIRDLLEKNEEYRDSDEKLACYIWEMEIKKKFGITAMSAKNFFKHFKKFQFTSYETIRRYRQKIQQDYPELKGKRKIKRKLDSYEIRTRVINNTL